MDEQTALFGEVASEAHTRRGDPWTSHEAARTLTIDKLRESQRAVYDLFAIFGPMHHEAAVATYDSVRRDHLWPPQSDSGIRTRTNELVRAGLLRNSGRYVVVGGSGRARRHAIVWEVAPPELTTTEATR